MAVQFFAAFEAIPLYVLDLILYEFLGIPTFDSVISFFLGIFSLVLGFVSSIFNSVTSFFSSLFSAICAWCTYILGLPGYFGRRTVAYLLYLWSLFWTWVWLLFHILVYRPLVFVIACLLFPFHCGYRFLVKVYRYITWFWYCVRSLLALPGYLWGKFVSHLSSFYLLARSTIRGYWVSTLSTIHGYWVSTRDLCLAIGFCLLYLGFSGFLFLYFIGFCLWTLYQSLYYLVSSTLFNSAVEGFRSILGIQRTMEPRAAPTQAATAAVQQPAEGRKEDIQPVSVQRSAHVPPTQSDVAPLVVRSGHQLEDIFNELAPHFEGRETEENWKKRDRHVIVLRQIVVGNAPKDFPQFFYPLLKVQLDAVFKAVFSLRTTLSSNGCYLVTDMARWLGPNIDGMVEIIIQNLFKVCVVSKKITSQNGNRAVIAVMASVSYSPRLLHHIQHAGADKNVQLRLFAAEWLRTIIDRHTSIKAAIEHGNGLNLMTTCIKQGLGDANPNVREEMRHTFWVFYDVWPTRANNINADLDTKSKLLLDKSQHKPKGQHPKTPSAADNTASAVVPESGRSALKSAIAAQRRVLKAQGPEDSPSEEPPAVAGPSAKPKGQHPKTPSAADNTASAVVPESGRSAPKSVIAAQKRVLRAQAPEYTPAEEPPAVVGPSIHSAPVRPKLRRPEGAKEAQEVSRKEKVRSYEYPDGSGRTPIKPMWGKKAPLKFNYPPPQRKTSKQAAAFSGDPFLALLLPTPESSPPVEAPEKKVHTIFDESMLSEDFMWKDEHGNRLPHEVPPTTEHRVADEDISLVLSIRGERRARPEQESSQVDELLEFNETPESNIETPESNIETPESNNEAPGFNGSVPSDVSFMSSFLRGSFEANHSPMIARPSLLEDDLFAGALLERTEEMSNRRPPVSPLPGSQDPNRSQQLLDRGIQLIRSNRMDPHGFRRLRRVLDSGGGAVVSEQQHRELVLALLGALQQGHHARGSAETALLPLLDVLEHTIRRGNEREKSEHILTRFSPDMYFLTTQAFLRTRMRFDSSCYFSVRLDEVARTLVQAELNEGKCRCIEAILETLGIENDQKNAENQKEQKNMIIMGLSLLAEALRQQNVSGVRLPEDIMKKIGSLAAGQIDAEHAEVRRLVVQVCVHLHAMDTEKFWMFLGTPSTGSRNLLAYYLARG